MAAPNRRLPRRRLALPIRSCVLVCLSVLLLLTFGLPTTSAQAPLTIAVGKTDGTGFPTVTAFVTLVDASGRPVLGLGPDSWQLTEDGSPVKAVKVSSTVNAQEPLHVVLVIDTSGSMQGRAIEDAKAAATTFVQGLSGIDNAAVVAFSDQPSLLQPFTGNKDELAKAIAGIKAAGETAFYDGLLLAAQTASGQQKGRRIIVALTDGADTKSTVKYEQALSGVQATGTPVFSVALGQQIDRNVLEGLAVGTGGVSLYAPSSADLRTAFGNIADQLRNQYILTFNSSLLADGGRHALVVKANVGGSQASANAVFIATSNPPEVTVVSPQPEQKVTGKVKVEVQVKAAGAVRKVEATAAGRVIGSVDKEPYVLEWDTSQLAAGNHILDVTAYDALGNRATKQVTVRVDAPAAPTAAPTAVPRPTPTATASSGIDLTQVLLGGGAIVALLAVGLVVARRSRRQPMPSAWERMPKDKPLTNCPTCGQPLKRGQECPDCRAKDEELIRRRVNELGDGEPGAPHGREDQR